MGVGVVDEAILDIGHLCSSDPRRHLTLRRRGAQAGRALAVCLALAIALAAAPAAARSPTDALEAALVSGESATAVLTRWCADHALADPARIVAVRDRAAHRAAPPSVRRALRAQAGERVAYRRVNLACGERVLSQADNWYLPGHLSAPMNQALETTDTPFGQVVAPLRFHRVALGVERPGAAAPGAPILRLSAVLVAGDGRPFAVVRERYLPALAP